jgi:hypothetical protein
MRLKCFGVILIATAVSVPQACLAQDPLPRIGVGVKVSTLGVGFEGSTAVMRTSNVRGAFNFLNYDRTVTKNGITYDAGLGLRSLEFVYDQYVFKGFHVSPGLLAYNGNHGDGTLSVPPGQSFTLGGIRYFSSQTNPIHGTARVDFRTAAPVLMAGVGNPLPRNGRRFGFNIDFGVVFQGPPMTSLVLNGTACATGPSTGCVNAATDPTVQSNVLAEQNKINNDLEPLKYYPMFSVGVSWRLK